MSDAFIHHLRLFEKPHFLENRFLDLSLHNSHWLITSLVLELECFLHLLFEIIFQNKFILDWLGLDLLDFLVRLVLLFGTVYGHLVHFVFVFFYDLFIFGRNNGFDVFMEIVFLQLTRWIHFLAILVRLHWLLVQLHIFDFGLIILFGSSARFPHRDFLMFLQLDLLGLLLLVLFLQLLQVLVLHIIRVLLGPFTLSLRLALLLGFLAPAFFFNHLPLLGFSAEVLLLEVLGLLLFVDGLDDFGDGVFVGGLGLLVLDLLVLQTGQNGVHRFLEFDGGHPLLLLDLQNLVEQFP